MTGEGWARVETDWAWAGLTALVLTNDRLRVVVLPELGGRVWQITELAGGTDLLWHHPRLQPQRVPFGTGYDDNFIGGWDELFPNDLPEELAGEPFPDHGEAWSERWNWQLLPGPDAAVRMSLTGRISGCELVRTVSLAPGSSTLRVDVEVTNTCDAVLPMLHKQHLAAALRPGSRVDLPGCRVEIGDFGRPRWGEPGQGFDWPGPPGIDFAGPPPLGTAELLFADRLAAGWCALTGGDGVGIGLAFDTDVYPACWTFGSWAGWRGLNVVVLEPCTGVGLSVADGQASGRHRALGLGETLRTTVHAVVYRGLRTVTSIVTDDGDCHVHGEAL